MRTDVKSLIVALTTERDSLTRAIAALQLIGGNGATAPAPTPTIAAPAKHRRSRAMSLIPEETKRAIVTAMTDVKAQGGNLSVASRRIARDYGISGATVLSSWKTWGRLLPTPTPEPAQELAIVQ